MRLCARASWWTGASLRSTSMDSRPCVAGFDPFAECAPGCGQGFRFGAKTPALAAARNPSIICTGTLPGNVTPTLARPAPLCPSDRRVGPTRERRDDGPGCNKPQLLQGPQPSSLSGDWTTISAPRPGKPKAEDPEPTANWGSLLTGRLQARIPPGEADISHFEILLEILVNAAVVFTGKNRQYCRKRPLSGLTTSAC